MVGFGFSIPRVALTPNKGVPFRVAIYGRWFERVTLDGAFAEIDGQPLYMEI